MKNNIHTPRPIVTTISGEVDLRAPTPGSIDTVEMAVSLARKGRYTDLSNVTVTVAQHLLLCDYLANLEGITDPATRMLILLHDAHEAYTGDIARPVKMLLKSQAPGVIEGIERRLDEAIFERHGLPIDMADPDHPAREAVHAIDTYALAVEVHWCFPNAEKTWSGLRDVRGQHGDYIGRLIQLGQSEVLTAFTSVLSHRQNLMFGATHAPATA